MGRRYSTPNLLKPSSSQNNIISIPKLKNKKMVQWLRSTVARLRSSPLNPKPSQSGLYHTIQAIPRECSGSRVSARDRDQGRIPAVVFSEKLGKSDGGVVRLIERKHLLTTERRQIQAIFESEKDDLFCSTTFPFQIRAGSGSSTLLESGTVLPIKVHRDEKTGKILNLVFVWADEGTKLTVDIPIVLKGEEECPGLKNGGSLNKIRSSLKYICPAEHIPPKIEVDISNLNIGDKILMSDIKVHPALKLLSKKETMPIIKINKPRAESSAQDKVQ